MPTTHLSAEHRRVLVQLDQLTRRGIVVTDGPPGIDELILVGYVYKTPIGALQITKSGAAAIDEI